MRDGWRGFRDAASLHLRFTLTSLADGVNFIMLSATYWSDQDTPGMEARKQWLSWVFDLHSFRIVT